MDGDDLENEAMLVPGRLQAVAFAVWNGENKERNGQKAVASWMQLQIDPVKPVSGGSEIRNTYFLNQSQVFNETNIFYRENANSGVVLFLVYRVECIPLASVLAQSANEQMTEEKALALAEQFGVDVGEVDEEIKKFLG